MTEQEKRQLVERLQNGRKRARARRSERLAALEAEMDAKARAYDAAREIGDYRLMADLRGDLRELGRRRLTLKWSE